VDSFPGDARAACVSSYAFDETRFIERLQKIDEAALKALVRAAVTLNASRARG
jgi:hypothetical protein